MAILDESPKTITITLPAAMAAKAEAWAEREGRTVSEVIGEAFYDYVGETLLRTMDDVRRYALTRNPHGYTEDDIPRLIKEVRAEEAAVKALGIAKAS